MSAVDTAIELETPSGESWGTLGNLLVATDGQPGANPAITAALVLLERGGGDVEVISVLEPLPILGAELGIEPPSAVLEQERRAALARTVESQLRTLGKADWRRKVIDGPPAQVIARAAEGAGARMILLGIGRHDVIHRLVGSETALQVLRLANVPVLAVAPGFSGAPRRVVVALDFSAGSLRAAREALAILAPNATVYLVHVAPRVELPPGVAQAAGTTSAEVIASAFQKAIDEIGFPGELTVETMTVRGDPASQILWVARATDADLIVVGSHGHGFFERMIIGSVATKVLRGAQCSVLAVPPMTDDLCRSCATDVEWERTDRSLEATEWATRLQEISTRNAGRDCSVEEDNVTFGAQTQGTEYRFRGAAYDRHDDRVDLMLSHASSHLTRSITHPFGVQVQLRADGRADTLRVEHHGGQTLVTFRD
jgi:nucleotide-binding universal stress UspA family protein